jgi:regulatory protein YycI of two-component signal transduction system YycFG
MIFAIATFLANSFGLNFDTARKWTTRGLYAVAALILLLVVILLFKKCGGSKATIDENAIQKIITANEIERKKELTKVIEDHSEVVTTADNRSTIAETNVIERDRKIAEKVKQANDAITAAKQQGRDVTGPELECLLTNQCP